MLHPMPTGWTARGPREFLVYDGMHPCSYLEGREARLPMRLPARSLAPEEFDARLAAGDRRHGTFLYRPSCPGCQACEAIRIPVNEFSFSGSQRRALRKGDAALELQMGPPVADASRLALYELHKEGRDLRSGEGEPLSLEGYYGFLVERCVDSVELRYLLDGRLIAVAIADRGARAVSAVYCYWDPAHALLGVGTYSVLKQVELCRSWGAEYLYLGLYIRDNPHMSYKARYRPHERLIGGAWRRFE